MYINNKKSQGFTLIEMSVVIIIIGLIVAGITKGQDLIKNSKINATITQISQYETAANAFQSKYGWLPGDFNKASTFIDSSLSDGNIDNNIHGGTALNNQQYANGEPTEFWNHLSKSSLISDEITQLDPTTNTVNATPGVHFPSTKLKKGGIAVMSNGQHKIWYVGTHNHMSFGGTTESLSPESAYAIDNKLDDGMPGTGHIFFAPFINYTKYAYTTMEKPTHSTTTACAEIGNGDTLIDPDENYNLTGVLSRCTLAIKTGF